MFGKFFSTSFVKVSSMVVRVVILLVLLLSMSPIQSKVTAATTQWCWCTDFVKNYFHLTGTGGDARTWDDSGGILERNGFIRIYKPEVGAVVVMNKGYPNADPRGHVGIIRTLNFSSGNTWKFSLWQGGQPLSGYAQNTVAGCNNIQIISWAAYTATGSTQSKYITYWRPPQLICK